MVAEYKIRRARVEDVPFICAAIISAEKGGTEKLSFSTLFDLSEDKVIQLLEKILLQQTKGSEFSIDNILVATYLEQPVASVTGWIELLKSDQSSSILKSNLISFNFPVEAIRSVSGKMHLLKNFIIDREKHVLQIEHVYVDPKHRGRCIATDLINQHIKDSISIFPKLEKVHLQVYENNIGAINSYNRQNFVIVKEVIERNIEILDYLPHNIKFLLEKKISKMDNNDIWKKLKVCLTSVLKHSDFQFSKDLVTTDIEGWTSLSHMIIVREIEIAFGVSFELEEYNKIKTIGSLTDLILTKIT